MVLRNCISFIFHLRSLFCSLWVYVSLHFLPIPWKTRLSCVSLVLCFLSVLMFWIRCNLKRLKNIWLIIHTGVFYILFSLYKNDLFKYKDREINLKNASKEVFSFLRIQQTLIFAIVIRCYRLRTLSTTLVISFILNLHMCSFNGWF